MKKLLNELLPVNHPQHFSLGIAEVIGGLVLIFNDYYFFYPPQLAQVLNDDLIGGFAIYFGIRTIKWALDDRDVIKINRNLLFFSAFFFGFEMISELIQALHHGSPTRLMVCGMAISLLIITFSIIKKSPKTKYGKH